MHELYWNDYVLIKGDRFNSFWELFLEKEKKNVLFILGNGFDPRMCHAISIIYPIVKSCKNDFMCWLIEFNEGDNSPSLKNNVFIKQNVQRLHTIIENKDLICSKIVNMWAGEANEKRRVCAISSTRLVEKGDIEKFTDVVLDISSLPQNIYYPLIGKILNVINNNNLDCNFHVIVAENPEIDKNIVSIGLDERAEYIHGFGNQSMMSETDQDVPKIWFPVLGEEAQQKLDKIYELIEPDEICPILPFPSKYPRRADEILKHYRQTLFDGWNIQIGNFIYADEQNPFQVYRNICNAVMSYDEALSPLGGGKYAISATSSKLLSLGALLAVHDLKKEGYKVGLANVDVHGYILNDIKNENITNTNELFNIWLSGDCYK